MKKTITEKGFEEYLRKKGCSERTPSGNPSTVHNYSARVKRIYRREGFQNLDDLACHVNDIVQKYDKDGEESDYGSQSHGSNIKALKLFREFVNN